MKTLRKLLVVSVMCLTCQVMLAQSLIKPINGNSFLSDIQSIENGIVNYQIGVSKMTMSTSDIALIEFSEGGVQYFHTEALQQIDPNTIGMPIYQRGHKVYIPFSSKKIAQRSGALKLRELVSEGGIWEVVDCKEEAHFILEFEYSEEGIDHASVVLKDRYGKTISQSSKANNSSRDPETKGEALAKTLYTKFVSKFDSEKIEIDKGRLLISGRKKGFVLRPELTVGYGINWAKTAVLYPTFNVGYQFNPYFSMGVGLGMCMFVNSYQYGSPIASQVYANLRVYLCDKLWSPFISLNVGRYGDTKSSLSEDYIYSLEGLDINGTLGLEYKHFNFGLTAGLISIREYNHTYLDDIKNRNDLLLALSLAYNIHLRKK